MSDANVLADLVRRLDAVEARSDALERENRVLRARLAEDDPPAPAAEPAEPAAAGEHPQVGRRALLRTGLAAGAVAAAGAVVLDAAPAAAANGGPLVMGQANTSTISTHWNMTNGTFSLASGTGSAIQVDSDTAGGTFAARFRNGYSGSGVEGSSQYAGTGVSGRSTVGAGVIGTSTDWYGVQGDASNGTGVVGFGVNGVSGIASGTGAGVGVVGSSGSGVGVRALASTGVAFDATSNGGAARLISSRFQLHLHNTATRLAPTGDAVSHAIGELVQDSAGNLWHCSVAGTPGRWRKVGGPATAGALHVLATPVRVYDSRPGQVPTAVGTKTPFAAGTTRTLDLTANASGVPVGATAAMVTVSLFNAANAAGSVTVWAAGAAQPLSTTLVWGGSAGRFVASTLTAVDTLSRIQVNAGAATDLAIDVAGYYT